MSDDIVRALGYLTLGSRFRRIGERLQSDSQRIFKAEGIDIPVALMPTVRAIYMKGSVTVGGLAESLGVAQPGVTRNISHLQREGLVESLKSGKDQRVHTIALTAKGRKLGERVMRDIEPRVSAAVADACRDLEGPLLDQLAQLEDALARRPLDQRGASRRKEPAA